jgi:hypothetical protein
VIFAGKVNRVKLRKVQKVMVNMFDPPTILAPPAVVMVARS